MHTTHVYCTSLTCINTHCAASLFLSESFPHWTCHCESSPPFSFSFPRTFAKVTGMGGEGRGGGEEWTQRNTEGWATCRMYETPERRESCSFVWGFLLSITLDYYFGSQLTGQKWKRRRGGGKRGGSTRLLKQQEEGWACLTMLQSKQDLLLLLWPPVLRVYSGFIQGSALAACNTNRMVTLAQVLTCRMYRRSEGKDGMEGWGTQ